MIVNTPKPMLLVHLRWMTKKDMPRVLEIERASFDDPWDEQAFLGVLRNRNCIGFVAEYAELVIGFLVKANYPTCFDLINFAVDPEYRRRGVMAQLVSRRVKSHLSIHQRTSIRCLVRETNLPAQLFLRAQGFRALEVVPQGYDANEDAYQMEFIHPELEPS